MSMGPHLIVGSKVANTRHMSQHIYKVMALMEYNKSGSIHEAKWLKLKYMNDMESSDLV